MKRRTLGVLLAAFSLVLAIIMITAILPAGILNSSATDEIGFDDFASNLMTMVDDYDKEDKVNAQSDEDDVAAQSDVSKGNSEFELKRLIVRSSRKLDDKGAVAKVEGYDELHIFQYATEEAAEEAYNYYTNLESVEFVDIDKIVTLDDPEVNTEPLVKAMSDESEYKSWGAEYMGVPEFKNYILNKYGISDLSQAVSRLPQVTVAVIDTGIDTDHEMFGGFYDEVNNPEGRILKNGKNLINNNELPEDDFGHGTHVSGTITELTLPNVKILPVKVLGNELGDNLVEALVTAYSCVCLGMEYSVNQGAKVVNMSVGTSGVSLWREYIVAKAYNKNKTLFVVAAGNDDLDANLFSPANIEKCITVSAINSGLERAFFSNYGDYIDVAAPGVDILSAEMGNSSGYISYDGTSMASPHVAGVAALYVTSDPGLSVSQLEEIIKKNAIDKGEKGFDKYYGYGIAYAAEPGFEPVELSFDKNGGKYDGPIELHINSSDPDVKIYYTLDWTIPTTASTLYNGSITIDKSSAVTAMAFKERDGKLYELSYTLLRNKISIDDNFVDSLLDFDKETGTIIGIKQNVPMGEITELYIPSKIDGVKVRAIGKAAFKDCLSLKSVKISDDVMSIGDSAFEGCKIFLESVIIGNGVTSIGASAFSGCEKLTSLKMGNAVTSIGDSAFAYCSSLKTITLPNSVTSIGDFVFEGCEKLKGITVGGKNGYYSSKNGVLYSKDKTTLLKYPEGKLDIVFVVPDTVTSIRDGAFNNCSSLSNITVNGKNQYYSSKDGVLYNKDKTKLIKYPKRKTNPNFTIPNSVISIVDNAFSNCNFLLKVEIPNSVTSIGDNAFYNCIILRKIDIPGNVKSIGDSAFSGCENLISVTIKYGVKLIGNSVFSGCSSLTSIEFPYGLTSIGDSAFSGCSGLTSITIPNTVTSIGCGSFSGCSGLTSINIPDNVTTIGDSAFYGCSSLASITIPNGAICINNTTFSNCKNLTSITIPNIVTYIGDSAFNCCSSLKYVYYLGNISQWENISIGNSNYNLTKAKIIYCHRVVFKDSDGKVLKTQIVEHGKAATAPASPTRVGYKFIGWDKIFNNVTSDLIVTANYSMEENCKVTFRAGAIDPKKTEKYRTVTVPYGRDPSLTVDKKEITDAKMGSAAFRLFYKPTGKWTDVNGNVVDSITSNTTLYAQYRFGLV